MRLNDANEGELARTPDGIRVLLQRHAYYDVLTRSVLDCARHCGLSGEDTMTVLAYEALKSREKLLEEVLLHYHTTPVIVKPV